MIPKLFALQVMNENVPQQTGQQLAQGMNQIQSLQVFNEQFFYLIALAVAAFAGFIFLRIYKNYSSYAGDGNRLGRYKMIMQNGERWTFNISEMEGFNSETFHALRETSDFTSDSIAIGKLEELVASGKLIAYDVKVTEWKEARDLRGKSNGILLSSAPIDDKFYSAKDREGYVTINSFPNKEFPRVFTAAKDSQVMEKQNVLTGEIIPIWVVAPMPIPDKRNPIAKFGMPEGISEVFPNEKFDESTYILNIELLPDIDKIADLVLHMKTFIKMHTILETKNIEIRKLVDMNESKDRELVELRIQVDEANTLANREPIEGERPKPPVPPKPFPFGWMIGCGIIGVFGAMMPQYVQQMSGFPPLFSGGLAVIIYAVVAYYMNKNETEVPTERLDMRAE